MKKNAKKTLASLILIFSLISSIAVYGAGRTVLKLEKAGSTLDSSVAPRSLPDDGVICYYDFPTEVTVESYDGDITIIKLISVQTGHIILESPLSSTATVLIPEVSQDWRVRVILENGDIYVGELTLQ